ncbi:MAG: carboxy terminal-processing peptidase [Acidobacteria bacterium]|nr:carboxy terminal-processing peptidase [Acidobacteriota bacterium]
MRFSIMLAMLMVLIPSWLRADSNLTAKEHQPELAKLVASYLTYYHYSKAMVDDEVAQRTLDLYLQSLDYNRMFFLAEDIKSFQTFATTLDDDLRGARYQIDKPFLIFNRFKKRVDERLALAMKLVEKDFDYTLDESVVVDRSEEPWAETTAELDELWRLRVKDQALRFRLSGKTDEEARDLLRKRYERLQKDFDEFDATDVLERYLSAVAQSFDPHSLYLKPATKDNFDIDMGHSLEGIGATLRREGEYTIVVDLIAGGPASLSGDVKPNDKIFAVGQGSEEPVDVVDMRIDRVVKLIRGPKGTEVKLHIIPADSVSNSETKVVSLTRDRVMITSDDASSSIEEVTTGDGTVHKYGVIKVPSFYLDTQARYNGDPEYKSTTRDVRKLIADLEEARVEGILIDLRDNSGGSLDESVELTGLFIKDGPVVQIRNRSGQLRVLEDTDEAMVYDGPLVVLTNVFSASASEIFAGAIQDYGRGLVIGDSATHGKGTVQNLIDLDRSLEEYIKENLEESTAGALKLTTHKFYRISGSSTQNRGVVPDVVLPSPYDRYEFGEEHLDYAMAWDEIEGAAHTDYGRVNPFLDAIRQKSEQRVSKEPEFQYLNDDYQAWLKRKRENRISLNESKRRAEIDEADQRDATRKAARKARYAPQKTDVEGNLDDVDLPDFVLKEAIQVLNDYTNITKGKFIASNEPAKK